MKSLHRRIAQTAFRRGLLTPESLCDVLAELGELDAKGEGPGLNYWLHTDWLDRAQVAEVLGDLGVGLQLGASPATDDISREAIEEAEQDLEFAVARTETSKSPPESGVGAFDRAPTTRDADLPGKFDSLSQTLLYESNETSLGSEETATDSPPSGGFDREPTMRFSPDAEAAESAPESKLPAPFGYAKTVIQSGLKALTERKPEGLEGVGKPGSPRYVLGRQLGRGGGGRVVRAFDRMLGRTVAMKLLVRESEVDEQTIARFVAEAQATGQLEHPNIVPLYDFGVLPTGEVFYTMREVRRQSLRKVLQSLKSGDPEIASEYNLVKLVSILRQVCQAVDYAHARGVIHRDLKPDNIMLGDYGEVLVMDWGLARIFESGVRTNNVGDESGQTLGTPAYMSPEQARGQLEDVDQKSDVYSIGAILYEVLTLEPPFVGENVVEVMWNVVDGELPSAHERAPEGRAVPDELERICARALHRDRSARHRSVREIHNELEDWLEGVQSFEAAQKVAEGDHSARLFRELERVVENLEEEVREVSATVDDWEPIERKRALWESEDQLEQAKASSARAFGDSVSQYTQALAFQADNGRARAGLARLFWERLRQARKARDVTSEIYFEALVRQYDEGKFTSQLDGEAQMSVVTSKTGASVTCFRFEEVDRRFVAAEEIDLGESPTEMHRLEPGRYLLLIQHPEAVPVRQPLMLERGERRNEALTLPEAASQQPGFLFIPGGPCSVGGDPFAFDARPARGVDVSPFFCAQFPVTFRQYLDFLNALQETNPALARERAPQTRGSDGYLVRFDEQRSKWVPDEILIEGPARERYPVGEGHEYDLPVVGVRAADAEAYCLWRADRDGRAYRLPTEDEIEKAGRGTDARIFPWGDRFDATFCKMRFSRPDMPQLEPVGIFVDDASPYGVRDLGGGVQEWCASRRGGNGQIERVVKGGAWNQDARPSRMASRITVLAEARAAGIGFRLVYSL